MTIEKPAPWSGGSGTEYLFDVFGLDPDVPQRPGLYIYAKRNDADAWVPLYIGAGDLATRCTEADLLQRIGEKNATHIHMRLMKRDEDRADELHDLLAHYKNAFPPDGCQPEADRPAAAEESATPPLV